MNVREKLDRIEKSCAPANQQIEQVKFAPWINCKLVLHYQFHYVLPICPGFKLVSCETCSVSTNEWAKKWKRIRSDSKKARRRQGTVGQPEQVHKQTHPGVIGSTAYMHVIIAQGHRSRCGRSVASMLGLEVYTWTLAVHPKIEPETISEVVSNFPREEVPLTPLTDTIHTLIFLTCAFILQALATCPTDCFLQVCCICCSTPLCD